MTILAICPCCSNTMLHYVGHHRDYWFCRSCWQEMPNLAEIERNHHQVEKPSLFTSQNVTVNRKKQIDDLSREALRNRLQNISLNNDGDHLQRRELLKTK